MMKKRELEIISALDTPLTISELADQLDWSASSVSKVVAELDEKGLVETHRDKRKVVEAANVEPVTRYRSLMQRYPHIEFPELLHGEAIPILFYLSDPITVSELAERTENYRNTVHRIVKRFQKRGLVRKRAGTYVLNDDFRELSEFAGALIAHLHRRLVPTSPATILWSGVNEFLLLTDEEIDDPSFKLTGPRRFADYGIPLVITDRRHYFYSERRSDLSPADVVCHMLLIDDGARYKSYCLLLLVKEPVDRTQLQERAAVYGVSAMVDELLTYLDTRGSHDDGVIRWTEFKELADDYGVTV